MLIDIGKLLAYGSDDVVHFDLEVFEFVAHASRRVYDKSQVQLRGQLRGRGWENDFPNRIIEMAPGFAFAYDLLGSSYWLLGDLDAAYNAYYQYHERTGRPAWFLEAAARGYKQGGFRGHGRELLAAIREHDDGSISHVVRAVIACAAEEPEDALVELNHALRRRDPKVLHIGKWPHLDCVRSDPRFQDLLREINWPGLEE